ncbi:MAG: phenylalanine--tRNA ligase subunit alpha [Bacteroidales bacterium]|nr:phenylalanine--tRNA ligase subunit alpha [Bacteroidales bacterium]
MSKIEEIYAEIEQFKIDSAEKLENFRLQFLSKKSELQTLLGEIKNVPAEERRAFGQKVNELKQKAQQYFDEHKQKLEDSVVESTGNNDLTRPAETVELGAAHPLSVVMNEVCEIFESLGFTRADGPEIEDDWHLFSALNFAPDHPARDMQDTFFVNQQPDIALRTHTSSIQVRVMENQKPPIRVICPGRVFRNEAITSRAHCMFHQIEGLYIAENVSFAEMKQTLMYFAKKMFGEETKIRLRPSYFPFTEPSAEMDVSCNICGGKGCALCKGSGWVEILGCGMVDPNVLENCGIDSKKYSGYAFGLGIERMTQVKYKTNDIRLFFENDIRFLQQFTGM